MVVLLVQNRSDIEAQVLYCKRTPPMLAVMGNKHENVKYLIEKGVRINARDCRGKNALDIAISDKRYFIKLLLCCYRITHSHPFEIFKAHYDIQINCQTENNMI